MKSYVPNTEKERREMLEAIGLKSMDDLFSDIPEDLKLDRELDLPAPMSEMELRELMMGYVLQNDEGGLLFRGAGAYRHYIPSVVPQLAARSEFYTAYTPYQAEMSQGMLQSIFEWQTVICNLTGMEASNASVYDGATAASEAILMMRDSKRKSKVLYSAGLNPDVITTIKTYAHCYGIELVEIPLNKDGITDMAALEANLPESAGFIAAQPNYFGCIENMDAISEAVHAQKALLVSYVNPISLGAVKRPGDYGADIAIGDAQPMGLPLNFGGPYVGFMATGGKLVRNLPGRIAGETTDAEGGRAYVLTLQAREQHIRRDKASSNICSNQMLCAIMSTIYACTMGPEGMREVAEQNIAKAHYLADEICKIPGMKLRYATAFFNEFVIDTETPAGQINEALKDMGIVGGLILPDGGMLWCATEMNSKEDIDFLTDMLKNIVEGGMEQ
ncbi:MAG: aminomethyl-transferring glycine dehydrogenase subunit GcvPA [Clostridia bacterium]|nr:aminomethyl-transferring glycine dehydrogenase subunit GcvPA [Clostridia bacterium]